MSGGWRRLVVVLCTLLLTGSVFLVLGVTVWAQEQPQPTEQPAETAEQPAQTGETTREQGLTIDYWEPRIGTRTVYYINDMLNDLHGDYYGTSWLGYKDAAFLYSTSVSPINYASSHYYNVDAVSDMNPVYFGLEGPWYFSMTTPFKCVEEIIGIHEAPDAHLFPYATYAVRYLYIGSGGHRFTAVSYRSNDATQQKWLEWGATMEFFAQGETYSRKEVVHYRSPSDKKMSTPGVIISFPLSVGTAGSYDAVYMEGGNINGASDSAAYEVVAEGKITTPAGTFDALMLRYDLTSPPDGERVSSMEYVWFAKDVGVVADALSLYNELDPLFETAMDIVVLEEQVLPGAPQ